MSNAQNIIAERLACGEISVDEYEKLLSQLATSDLVAKAGMATQEQRSADSTVGTTPVPLKHSHEKNRKWKSLTKLDRYSFFALLAYFVAQIKLLRTYAFPETPTELAAASAYLHQSSMDAQVADSLVVAGGLILTVVSFVWIYRLTNNLFACGLSPLNISPAWSVGWFFVPVAFFWKPYQAISQLERSSRLGHGWHEGSTHPSVICWWILYWGSIAFLVASLVIAGDESATLSDTDTQAAMMMTILSTGVELVCWAILLAILGSASQRLSEQYGVPYQSIFGPSRTG